MKLTWIRNPSFNGVPNPSQHPVYWIDFSRQGTFTWGSVRVSVQFHCCQFNSPELRITNCLPFAFAYLILQELKLQSSVAAWKLAQTLRLHLQLLIVFELICKYRSVTQVSGWNDNFSGVRTQKLRQFPNTLVRLHLHLSMVSEYFLPRITFTCDNMCFVLKN